MSDDKVLFPDTNIFLHYRPVLEIPWQQLAGAPRVLIVIPRVVIRELDKQKLEHMNPKIRERARRALAELLTEARRVTDIKPAVGVELETGFPDLDYKASGLNREWQDDVFLASALVRHRVDQTSEVIVVTADTGVELKARSLGLGVLVLPDKFRLPSTVDPAEAELQRLRRELAEIKAAAPRLAVLFSNGERILHFRWPQPWEMDDIEFTVARQRESLRYKPPAGSPSTSMLALLGAGPSEQSIAHYEVELNEYLVAYRQFVESRNNWRESHARVYEIWLSLVNTGGAPAESIHVHLHFPSGFALVTEADLVPHPEAPRAPSKPMGTIESVLGMPTMPSILPSLLWRDPASTEPANVSPPRIRETESCEVEYHIRGLQHGLDESLGPLYLDYGGYESPRSFSIEYRLLTGNLPQEVKGTVAIAFDESTAKDQVGER